MFIKASQLFSLKMQRSFMLWYTPTGTVSFYAGRYMYTVDGGLTFFDYLERGFHTAVFTCPTRHTINNRLPSLRHFRYGLECYFPDPHLDSSFYHRPVRSLRDMNSRTHSSYRDRCGDSDRWNCRIRLYLNTSERNSLCFRSTSIHLQIISAKTLLIKC